MKKLLILRSAALTASLVTMSFASLATSTTGPSDDTYWNFTSNGLAAASGQDTAWGSGQSYGNNMLLSNDGFEVTITAWADTGEVSGDDRIESAAVSRNNSGLLNYNRHYSDNYDSHYVDNYGDTDMLLFTFDDLVSITGIDLGYFNNDSDISIAAFDSLPTLQGQTWANVADGASFSASFTDIGTTNYSIATSTAGVDSKYWVIGAYNSSFGTVSDSDQFGDKLKIAGITTVAGSSPDPKPPTDVAEPSSLAVLASFGLFAAWRRRKSA